MADNNTISQEDMNYAVQVFAMVRLGLGLDKFGEGKPLTPALIEETVNAYEAKAAQSGSNLAQNLAQAATQSSFRPPLIAPRMTVTPEKMQEYITDLPTAITVLGSSLPAATPVNGNPTAGATTTTTPVVASSSPEIRRAETLLSSFGINVGAVDGKRDAQFDKAVGDLKTLVKAVMPTVAISAGAGLTANDLKVLETGLNNFAASQEFKDLQAIRRGQVPASVTGLDAMGLRAGLAFESTEAGRIKFALDAKSEKDPALKASLAKIPAGILAKMPQILDGLGNADNRAALVKGLGDAYAAPVVTTTVPVTPVTGGTPTAPVIIAGETPVVVTQNPETVPETAITTTTDETPVDPVANVAQVQAASELLEQIMVDKINPMLDKFAGGFQMVGITPSDLLPVLTQADVGGDFDAKSQQMAAAMIMGMKSLAGIKPPDGTYNETIAKQLKIAILTDEKMGMVRDAFGAPLVSRQEAEALLADPEALKKHKEFYLFFQSLDTLEQAKALDRDNVAKSMTRNNLMLDGLSKFLDKSEWGQQTKAWLKDFLANSQIGQMIGSVLSMFGFNIGRLWGDKNDAAGIENAKPTLERIYSGYVDDAQKDLGPNAAFKDVMAKTRENIMSDMESSPSFNMGMKMIFGNADKDKIKEAIDKALEAAGNQPNAESAKQMFVNSLVEMGKQYRNGQEVDLDQALKLLSEARGTVEGARNDPDLRSMIEATPTQPNPASGQPQNTPVVPTGEENKGAAVTSDAGSSNAPANVLTASATVGQADAVTADIAANRIEAGDKDIRFVYVPDPKDYTQRMMPSNGRVQDMLEVVNDNHGALKMSLDMSLIKDAQGVVVDKATKPACAVLEELSVRAHIAHQLRESETVDPATLDRKIDSPEDIRIVASYLLESGVSEADVQKFRTAAESLRADATIEKGFINTPQLNIVEVSAIASRANADRVAAAAGADPNAVKVDPKDAHLYELYKKVNEGHGANCAPLIVMGRVGDDGKIVTLAEDKANGQEIKLDENGNPEGYKVFVGVVENNRDADKTNDVFKVLEVKDFIDNGMKIGAGDPAYDALANNYRWSTPVREVIDNYIKTSLCLNDPKPALTTEATTVVPNNTAAADAAKSSIEITAQSREVVQQDRPLPTRYEHLASEPFRISKAQADNLDGGKLNLTHMYTVLQQSSITAAANGGKAIWTELPAFRQGPYMLTPLENPQDRARLGGDVVVSRMADGQMIHSVIDTKKDGIIHPSEYSNVAKGDGSFFGQNESPADTADRLKGKNVRIGFDELLDTNVSNSSIGGHSDGMGTSFGYMVVIVKKGESYKAESAFDEFFGVGELKMDAILKGDRGAAAKVMDLQKEYDAERLQRGNERFGAERQISNALSSANVREFGSVSGLAAESSDPILVASQNFSDMGMTDNALSDDVGGFTPQQLKSMSYGATA